MALETVVFQQDPFGYGCFTDISNVGGSWIHGFGLKEEEEIANLHQSLQEIKSGICDSSPTSSMTQNIKELDTNSSQENWTAAAACGGGDGFFPDGLCPLATTGRRKRRRCRSTKNQEEAEHQRMSHITVERNRRKQMNDYLSVLRSMMPPSYVQRGDQASIIGGAINFVKELEQLLQSLEAQKRIKKQSSQEDTKTSSPDDDHHHLFSDFFSFPQYSTRSSNPHKSSSGGGDESLFSEKQPWLAMADVEVTMVETHANLKILSRKQPKQIFKMVTGLYSLHLSVLHLNVTTSTVDDMVLFSLSVKVEEECQFTTVNEIAAAVHGLMGKIQEEAISNFSCPS